MSRRLRDESTPAGRAIWADVDKAATRLRRDRLFTEIGEQAVRVEMKRRFGLVGAFTVEQLRLTAMVGECADEFGKEPAP